jgi:hypothetical protein
MKVLSPLKGRNGKTYWMRIGNAYENQDGSTNVYLDAFPTSGKLHIRDLDERDLRQSSAAPENAEAHDAGNSLTTRSEPLPF